MMCAKFGIIVIANTDLVMGGGGTYETPYTKDKNATFFFMDLFFI